jgi:hypothetical protein
VTEAAREPKPVCVLCRGRIEDAPVHLATYSHALANRHKGAIVFFVHPDCLKRVAVKPFAGVDEL